MIMAEQVSAAQVFERLGAITDDVADIKAAVFGNGKPGLKTDVDRVKIAQANCMEERKIRRNLRDKVMAALVIAIVVNISAQLWAAFM